MSAADGVRLAIEAGDWQQAASTAEAALGTGEVPREIMEQLAKGCFDAGLHAQALPWADRLTRVDPHNAKYWHALGMVRRKLGDFEGAHEAQRATLAIDPHHLGANTELAKIVRDRELAAAAETASPLPEPPEEDPAPSELPSRHRRATWRAAIVAGTAAAVVVLVVLAFVLGQNTNPPDVVLVAPGPKLPPLPSAHPVAQSPDAEPVSSGQVPAAPPPASSWDGTGTPPRTTAPLALSAAPPQVAGSTGYGGRPQRAASGPRPQSLPGAGIAPRPSPPQAPDVERRQEEQPRQSFGYSPIAAQVCNLCVVTPLSGLTVLVIDAASWAAWREGQAQITGPGGGSFQVKLGPWSRPVMTDAEGVASLVVPTGVSLTVRVGTSEQVLMPGHGLEQTILIPPGTPQYILRVVPRVGR